MHVAGRINDVLAHSGSARCEGGIVAAQVRCRTTLDERCDAYPRWLATRSPKPCRQRASALT
ncbi:hypothetical protein [Methyloversatilis sp.]|uniref:hypothetical protein n=1 Tax=Methyloversatilis sp. TaxID=2569862 RepID=UPI0035AD7EB4